MKAWDIERGEENIIIGMIDSGGDKNHVDGYNVWINKGEIPNNGKDDDNNGYIDDWWGFNFCYVKGGDNTYEPIDDCGHGTHCHGIAAAIGDNGTGIVGVAMENVKVMHVKFLNKYGYGTLDNAFKAILYAVDNGADIISMSWGARVPDTLPIPLLEEALKYAYENNCILVAAAGNNSQPVKFFSPANSKYVLTVAATTSKDKRAYFSNYGKEVEISAPGSQILSLNAENGWLSRYGPVIDEDYLVLSGTSMATPFVSGAAALLLSYNSHLSNEYIYRLLQETADEIEQDSCVIGPRLNIGRAMKKLRGEFPREILDVYVYPTIFFGNSITISYRLRGDGNISAGIYDILGRRIKTLINGKFEAGEYSITWDGRDDKNRVLPPGNYFILFRTEDENVSKKILYVK